MKTGTPVTVYPDRRAVVLSSRTIEDGRVTLVTVQYAADNSVEYDVPASLVTIRVEP